MSSSSHIYISYFWYITSLLVLLRSSSSTLLSLFIRRVLNSAVQYDFCCSKGFSNKMSTGDYVSNCNYNVVSVLEMTATVEPRFNETLYIEVLGLTNDILHPSIYGKIYDERTSI